MHYIKCTECGHFNEVKSEYLVFCTKCNKKLDNNFPDWNKKNQGRGFEDYKRLVCVTEEEIITLPVKVKTRPKGLKYWVGFAVAFAIFYAIGQFGGESIVRFIKSQRASREIINQDWQKERYGDFGLFVETPVRLIKGDLNLPENLRSLIDVMDVYNFTSARGFTIMINNIRYKPEVGSLSLQGAADGEVNEIKLQQGVTAFNYTEDPFSKNDVPGFIQKGTFKKDGIDVEFINTGFAHGMIFYQVLVAWQSGDEASGKAAKRVIESIEIMPDLKAI